MSVKALYDYDFPSMDRAEVFDDDVLVYVHWEGNPIFCSAACFRVPKTMPFGEFVTSFVVPWADLRDAERSPGEYGKRSTGISGMDISVPASVGRSGSSAGSSGAGPRRISAGM